MMQAPRTVAMGLRSALYLTVLALTVAPFSIGTLLWSWLPRTRRYWMVTGWTRFAIFSARHLCGIDCRVEGMHNLPDGPAIVLPKHQSAWETLWITTALPRPLTFVYKRELHYIPFFGWGLATLGMINIDRARGGDAFEQVAEQGAKCLARGWWIVIFPEGTRTHPGARPHYKTGGARLALRTGVPVVPIALDSGEFWPRRSFLKTPGTITVRIGPPIAPKGLDALQLTARVEGWIEQQMHELAPHRYAPGALAQAQHG